MRIGIPLETKDREYRVGMVPDGVRTLVADGHEVWIEQGAGLGSGFSDSAYQEAGAKIVDCAAAWGDVEMVVKVKEPNATEAGRLGSGQILFTYLHLAAEPALTRILQEADVYAIGYETIRDPDGTFPVLAPMSEVAGRLAAQIGAQLLQKDQSGKGILLGGVPGVRRGRVCVLGAGTVGINALRIAHALGAEVDVLDVNLQRLTYIYDLFHGELNTLYSNPMNIERSVRNADLVIGAVYTFGRRAPTLVDEALVESMEPGSVLVDVAVDQGGCIETIHPTRHSEPTYVQHGVLHYGVPNMPGAVPRTSTIALSNTTLGFARSLASKGAVAAVREDPQLAQGANVWRGRIVCEGVAESLNLEYTPIETLLDT